MHDESAATGFVKRPDKVLHERIVVLMIHADAVLDRGLKTARFSDRLKALRHELGLKHQAGAKRAFLDALGQISLNRQLLFSS